jgi:hypothetical protein
MMAASQKRHRCGSFAARNLLSPRDSLSAADSVRDHTIGQIPYSRCIPRGSISQASSTTSRRQWSSNLCDAHAPGGGAAWQGKERTASGQATRPCSLRRFAHGYTVGGDAANTRAGSQFHRTKHACSLSSSSHLLRYVRSWSNSGGPGVRGDVKQSGSETS